MFGVACVREPALSGVRPSGWLLRSRPPLSYRKSQWTPATGSRPGHTSAPIACPSLPDVAVAKQRAGTALQVGAPPALDTVRRMSHTCLLSYSGIFLMVSVSTRCPTCGDTCPSDAVFCISFDAALAHPLQARRGCSSCRPCPRYGGDHQAWRGPVEALASSWLSASAQPSGWPYSRCCLWLPTSAPTCPASTRSVGSSCSPERCTSSAGCRRSPHGHPVPHRPAFLAPLASIACCAPSSAWNNSLGSIGRRNDCHGTEAV